MRGRRTRRCRSRTTSSKDKAAARQRTRRAACGRPGASLRCGSTAHRREGCHGRLYRSSLDAGGADGLGDFGPVVHDHPPAAGRLRDLVHRLDVGVGQRGVRRRGAGAARAARPRQAHLRPVREVDGPDPAGQFRHGDGMGTPRVRRHRRPSDADDGHFGGGDHLHLGHRACPSGSTPRSARTRSWTTSFTFIGFIGLAIPGFLLALVVMYVGFALLRREHRRALLARLHRGALEHGKGLGSHQAPADPGHRPGRGRNRAADPHHALQPARRIAQALRDDGARARPSGIPGHHAVSGAGGPQSVRQHHRLSPSLRRVGQHHRVAGA